EGVEALLVGELPQLLDPPVHGPVEGTVRRAVGDRPRHVEDAADLAAAPAGFVERIVEPTGHLGDRAELTAEGRHPAIGDPGREGERLRAVDAEPDPDRVLGHRTALGTSEVVVAALDAEVPLAAP